VELVFRIVEALVEEVTLAVLVAQVVVVFLVLVVDLVLEGVRVEVVLDRVLVYENTLVEVAALLEALVDVALLLGAMVNVALLALETTTSSKIGMRLELAAALVELVTNEMDVTFAPPWLPPDGLLASLVKPLP
jgi:hypothetical protein